MGSYIVFVEKRRNDRAKCQVCKEVVVKGTIALGITSYQQNPAYVHKKCVDKMVKEVQNEVTNG